jgi:hypothetical protein
MADFTAAFTAGVTVESWTDPVSGNKPSRINAFPEHPHLRHVGTVGVEVEVTATVNGVAGEVDSNLGGRLFTATFAETPSEFLLFPDFSNPAGQSSVQRFTPDAAGHWTLRLKRLDGGGAIYFHLDVS